MQAIRPGVHGAKDGAFRATFEDKPLLSDIVFLRAWVAVDLPRFYNPVTNLLAPAPVSHRAPKPSKVLFSPPCNPDMSIRFLPHATLSKHEQCSLIYTLLSFCAPCGSLYRLFIRHMLASQGPTSWAPCIAIR